MTIYEPKLWPCDRVKKVPYSFWFTWPFVCIILLTIQIDEYECYSIWHCSILCYYMSHRIGHVCMNSIWWIIIKSDDWWHGHIAQTIWSDSQSTGVYKLCLTWLFPSIIKSVGQKETLYSFTQLSENGRAPNVCPNTERLFHVHSKKKPKMERCISFAFECIWYLKNSFLQGYGQKVSFFF